MQDSSTTPTGALLLLLGHGALTRTACDVIYLPGGYIAEEKRQRKLLLDIWGAMSIRCAGVVTLFTFMRVVGSPQDGHEKPFAGKLNFDANRCFTLSNSETRYFCFFSVGVYEYYNSNIYF